MRVFSSVSFITSENTIRHSFIIPDSYNIAPSNMLCSFASPFLLFPYAPPNSFILWVDPLRSHRSLPARWNWFGPNLRSPQPGPMLVFPPISGPKLSKVLSVVVFIVSEVIFPPSPFFPKFLLVSCFSLKQWLPALKSHSFQGFSYLSQFVANMCRIYAMASVYTIIAILALAVRMRYVCGCQGRKR